MVAAIKFKNVRSILILPFFLISRSGAWWTVLFPSLISKKHRRGSTSTGQADIGACWWLWRMCHLAISVLGGGDGGHNIMDSWNHYLFDFLRRCTSFLSRNIEYQLPNIQRVFYSSSSWSAVWWNSELISGQYFPPISSNNKTWSILFLSNCSSFDKLVV